MEKYSGKAVPNEISAHSNTPEMLKKNKTNQRRQCVNKKLKFGKSNEAKQKSRDLLLPYSLYPTQAGLAQFLLRATPSHLLLLQHMLVGSSDTLFSHPIWWELEVPPENRILRNIELFSHFSRNLQFQLLTSLLSVVSHDESCLLQTKFLYRTLSAPAPEPTYRRPKISATKKR